MFHLPIPAELSLLREQLVVKLMGGKRGSHFHFVEMYTTHDETYDETQRFERKNICLPTLPRPTQTRQRCWGNVVVETLFPGMFPRLRAHATFVAEAKMFLCF